MIVGNGLLAKAFKVYQDVEIDAIIFASGVSDSNCVDELQFLREKQLVERYIKMTGKFVYFSTCSIYDDSLKTSRYIAHKLELENLIATNSNDYLIIRLPNIVGHTGNPKTMLNYFYAQIIANKELVIQKNATRYLMDVEDVSYWTIEILKRGVQNQIINMAFNNKIKVINLVEAIKKYTKRNVNYKLLDAGVSYDIDTKEFSEIIKGLNSEYYAQPDYLLKILHKYFSKIAEPVL